jgi:peptide/nickel transport system substrate-binding protein
MDMAQSIQNTFGQIGITVELNVGDGAEQLEPTAAASMTSRCKAGGRTIPTRTPTPRPLR